VPENREGVAVRDWETDDSIRRGSRVLGVPALRGLLVGSLLAGTLVIGGGALIASAPAGAQTTCPVSGPATAAQNASTTGITPNSVTVGNVSIISGPVPSLFQGASYGVKAYFDMINAKGGVYGRKLKVDAKDDAFSGAQNQTETQGAVNSDFAMVGSFSLFDGYGCKVLAADPAVPDVSVTLDPNAGALPNDFSTAPTVLGASLGPFQYYKKHYPKNLTIGAIVSDVSSAEKQFQGEMAAAQHVGYKQGYVDYINPLQKDFTTDVINMRNKGVNAVDLTAVDWQDAAIFVQNAATQNWHPGLIFSGGPVYAKQFISHAGGPAVANGVMIGQGFPLYLGEDSSSVPAVNQFLKYTKQVNSSWVPDLYTLFGWASGQLFVQALQAAGPHPTRGAVIDQLKKITNFDASGMVSPSNPAAKKPSGCFVMATIKNGKYVRVVPKSGFDCNTSYFYAPSTSS
jgi:ABC-type branched-subunit amino acid transport system substrate-binding protein